jgi:tetratricopeptide (TPR) repeat protein
MNLGRPHGALNDISRVIALEPSPASHLSRGKVYRHLGRYEAALNDFATAESMAPGEWQEDSLGLLYQADCHARLGHLDNALDCCARMPNDFWTPGVNGAPSGGRAEIAQRLREIAASRRSKAKRPPE